MGEGVRVQKVLSDMGFASRRAAEKLIEEGRVKINGRVCVIGQKIDPRKDVISVDGEKVVKEYGKNKRRWYIALNKPRGYVTTMSDELGRKCVTELLGDIDERVYPVGRLDKNSEGLLLLTNDGEFANLMMHPSYHINKTYRVTVDAGLNEEQLIELASGVEIDGKMTLPAIVTVLVREPQRAVIQMVISEGRNRQIRKMCEAVGLEVLRLKRTAVGGIRLGMLKPGEWRELTAQEVKMLRNQAGKKAEVRK